MDPIDFPAECLDSDAVAVVSQLQQRGYTAYLVGGCVRDALLGRRPKDFDIATGATPEELKDVFGRRCRLIGRRFKLAHVRAGRKVFEVATFRGLPEEQTTEDDSEFVVRANIFGTPEQDARSRDFTINGLFYDPVRAELHDHVGGLPDIEERRLRTIGDAEQRFREDPVRLLRAVKFAGRLDFALDGDIQAVAREMAPLVHDCPVARVTEEIFRMHESGHARPTMTVLRDLGIADLVVPEVVAALEEGPLSWAAWLDWLGVVDHMVRAHGGVPREGLFALLVWPLVRPRILAADEAGRHDWGKVAIEAIREASVRMAIPVRQRQHLRATANVMRRIGRARRGRPRGNLPRSPALPMALSLLRAEFLAGVSDERETYEYWAGLCRERGIAAAPFEPRVEDTDDGDSSARGDRQGRRRGRRRRPKSAANE